MDAAFPPLDGRHVAATLHQITALLEPSYRLMEQYAEQFEVRESHTLTTTDLQPRKITALSPQQLLSFVCA